MIKKQDHRSFVEKIWGSIGSRLYSFYSYWFDTDKKSNGENDEQQKPRAMTDEQQKRVDNIIAEALKNVNDQVLETAFNQFD